jgi:C4-dicarboxylate-specific signal transduction histidine kinase
LVNSLVQETLDIMRNKIFRHGVKLTTNLEKTPIFVFADKIQLQQVLLNFLRNSIEAKGKNDSDDKRIKVSMNLVKDSVIVSVSDSEPWIDKSILEKVFKPFVTTGNTGFGIGLGISRSIIENHDGEIWAGNIPGEGAEFSFRLLTLKKR